jgi:hypothetical protein
MGEAADVLVVGMDLPLMVGFIILNLDRLGANWGSGHRGGRISTLICAVRDDLHPANVASSSTV